MDAPPALRTPADRRRTIAVVPVRSLEGAKSRLGDVLDAEERRELVERLLVRTLGALRAVERIAAVIVVSADPEVLALAAVHGASGLAQDTPGLNLGLEQARRTASDDDRLLVVPGDLPAIEAGAIEALLDAADAAGPPCVVLVTDRHGRGTNALLLDPAGLMPFAFGGDSRLAHASAARGAGARLVEVAGPLELDLDTADDLLQAGALVVDGVRVS